MADLKKAYITQELGDILGITPQATRKRASRENWQSRPRAGRGGGREWIAAAGSY